MRRPNLDPRLRLRRVFHVRDHIWSHFRVTPSTGNTNVNTKAARGTVDALGRCGCVGAEKQSATKVHPAGRLHIHDAGGSPREGSVTEGDYWALLSPNLVSAAQRRESTVKLLSRTMLGYDISTEIVYFSSDAKFQVEKSYTTAFPILDRPGAKSTNHEFESHLVLVHDVWTHGFFDLNGAGFQFIKHRTSLIREEFDSNNTVEDRYYSEINDFIQKKFPQYLATAFLAYEITLQRPRP